MQVENHLRSIVEDIKNTSRTNHNIFDRDGFFVIKNIVDVSPFNKEIPEGYGYYDHSNGNVISREEGGVDAMTKADLDLKSLFFLKEIVERAKSL